jgi:GNAT superfamily N-acetyltransferase
MKRAIIRPARAGDIPAMHRIRLAVRENALSDASRVREEDYAPFLGTRGRSWVAEAAGEMVGFAALDVGSASIWALFVAPDAEARGVGSLLLGAVESHARQVGLSRLRLSTGSGTRAETFYERRGWRRCGVSQAGEIMFELNLVPPQATGDS